MNPIVRMQRPSAMLGGSPYVQPASAGPVPAASGVSVSGSVQVTGLLVLIMLAGVVYLAKTL